MRAIMFQGTASGVGKSLLAAGFCRLLANQGYIVKPFKSQNMALNSGVTPAGLEMGRAQILQAEACRTIPDVRMNPILLKPQGDSKSQLICLGKVQAVLSAKDYYKLTQQHFELATQAYKELAAEVDFMVLEGAGSPAEINLQQQDITNMKMAEFAKAAVLIIGNIQKGGVFAALKGTYDLLPHNSQQWVKGFIINKFLGDQTLLNPGIEQFKAIIPKPILMTVPYLKELNLDEEDSLGIQSKIVHNPQFKIVVIRLPYLANFTDFQALMHLPSTSVVFTTNPKDLMDADLIILPGSKSTASDLEFLKTQKLDQALEKRKGQVWVCGICGGFQMLGQQIKDPNHMESHINTIEGLAWIQMQTTLEPTKTLKQQTYLGAGMFDKIKFLGYEVHLGVSEMDDINFKTFIHHEKLLGVINMKQKILGTYIHGIFDSKPFFQQFLKLISGQDWEIEDYQAAKERQLDQLAQILKQGQLLEKLNIPKIKK